MNESVIPKGDYCYSEKSVCPYWSVREDRVEQENGYCSFLGKGDVEINQTAVLEDMDTGEKISGKDIPFPVGLLWDQVKECGINDEYED